MQGGLSVIMHTNTHQIQGTQWRSVPVSHSAGDGFQQGSALYSDSP